jgi:hypothetical protein
MVFAKNKHTSASHIPYHQHLTTTYYYIPAGLRFSRTRQTQYPKQVKKGKHMLLSYRRFTLFLPAAFIYAIVAGNDCINKLARLRLTNKNCCVRLNFANPEGRHNQAGRITRTGRAALWIILNEIK